MTALKINRTAHQTDYTVTNDFKTYCLSVVPNEVTADEAETVLSWYVQYRDMSYDNVKVYPADARAQAETEALSTLRKWIDADLFDFQTAMQNALCEVVEAEESAAIEEGLDPQRVALLGVGHTRIFDRMKAGEELPAQEIVRILGARIAAL